MTTCLCRVRGACAVCAMLTLCMRCWRSASGGWWWHRRMAPCPPVVVTTSAIMRQRCGSASNSRPRRLPAQKQAQFGEREGSGDVVAAGRAARLVCAWPHAHAQRERLLRAPCHPFLPEDTHLPTSRRPTAPSPSLVIHFMPAAAAVAPTGPAAHAHTQRWRPSHRACPWDAAATPGRLPCRLRHAARLLWHARVIRARGRGGGWRGPPPPHAARPAAPGRHSDAHLRRCPLL